VQSELHFSHLNSSARNNLLVVQRTHSERYVKKPSHFFALINTEENPVEIYMLVITLKVRFQVLAATSVRIAVFLDVRGVTTQNNIVILN
jgi:hypothetical protein